MNAGNFKTDIKIGYAGALKSNTNEQQKFFLKVDENRDVPNSEKKLPENVRSAFKLV